MTNEDGHWSLVIGHWSFMPGFDILYEHGPVLVVNKPPGLLTQAPPGIDSLELRVKRFLKDREQKPGEVYLGVPHRLDRPVSGAIVLAKHVRAARRISEQFEARTVRKIYWALVEGSVGEDADTWIDQLKKLENEPRAVVVDASDVEGRTAVLHYRVLQRLPTATLLEIELETGRMHQIRVQCAARGHPLLGDDHYGATMPFGPPSVDQRERLIALHARNLQFRHPMTDEPLSISAPLTAWWHELGIQQIDAPTTESQP
jgi:23S rRNA pseudouridine1911/1915/1917 synthase